MKQSILIIFILVLSWSLTATVIEQTLNFTVPSLTELAGYTYLQMEDCRSIGNPGEPALPRRGVTLLLPPGESISEVQIFTASPLQLTEGVEIFPVQREYPISQQHLAVFTPPEAAIYDSSEPFPSSLTGFTQTHFLRGYSLAYLDVCPVVYLPDQGMISWYPEITIRLETSAHIKARQSHASFYRDDTNTRNRVLSKISNPQQLEQFYPQLDKRSREEAYELLIITIDEFIDHVQPLAEYKQVTGFRTQVITTSQIESEYTGSDLQEKIRNCIIDQYQEYDIEYLLLAGDNENIPRRGFYDSAGGYENEYDIPADIYYSHLDGNWNTDNDNMWGEPGEDDLLGELYVARLACDNAVEFTNFINKIIRYQSTPCLEDIETALMVGENLGWSVWGMDFKEEIRLGSDNFGYSTAGIADNFDVSTLYDLQGTWSPLGDLVPALNAGPHLVNHMGHCDVTYAMKLYNNNMNETTITNDGIENGHYILYSQGCYCGAFDNRNSWGSYEDDCITEAWTGLATGPVAMVTNSRYGWGNLYSTDGSSQYYDRQFFDAIFGENITIIGQTQLDAKEDNIPFINYSQNRWCFYCSNLFGDPTMDIWTAEPQEVIASHNGVLITGQQNYQVQVTTPSGYPVEGALIALSVDGQSVGLDLTNQNGYASVDLQGQVILPGVITLSITGHNLLPQLEEFPIIPPEGPYVVLNSYSVLAGDDDYLEAGETVLLNLVLKNIGVETAENLNVILSCEDEYITILDGEEPISGIPAGDTFGTGNAFSFFIDPDVPDHHPFLLNGEVHSGEDIWLFSLALMAFEPNVFSVSPASYNIQLGWQDIVTDTLFITNVSDRTIDYLIRTQESIGRDLTGSFLVCNTDNFTPGESADWIFTVYNLSPDNEWVTDVNIQFQPGITVNSAGNFVGGSGGDLVFDGTLGEGVEINWHGTTSIGYGVLHQNQSAVALVNVDITTEIAGNINLTYEITGDGYGAAPHTITGTISLDYPLSWISLSGSAGSLAPGETVALEVTFNANELTLGTHTCDIIIHDGSRDQKRVPVNVIVTNTSVEEEVLPGRSALAGNFPNPFNPETVISFYLGSDISWADLQIFNLKGQLVKSYDLTAQPRGSWQQVIWNGRDEFGSPVGSGLFFYRLVTDSESYTEKMLLLK